MIFMLNFFLFVILDHSSSSNWLIPIRSEISQIKFEKLDLKEFENDRRIYGSEHCKLIYDQGINEIFLNL